MRWIFLEIMGWRKIRNEKGLSHTHIEASHFLMFWRVLLLIKLIQIETIFLIMFHIWSSIFGELPRIFSNLSAGQTDAKTSLTCAHMVIKTRVKRCKDNILLWDFYHLIKFSRMRNESPIHMDFCRFFLFEKECENIPFLVACAGEGADRHIIDKSPFAWRNSFLW